MSKNKCYNILAIDDENDALEALEIEAPDNFSLVGAKSLEEAKEIIQNKQKGYFKGFILDFFCSIRKEEPARANFLREALKYFDDNHQGYPIVIRTGQGKNFRIKEQYQDIKTYCKGEDNFEAMFSSLRNKIKKLPETIARENYPDVFMIFEKSFLDLIYEEELIGALFDMQNYQLTNIKNNLARIRRIQEAIYIAINKNYPDIVPTSHLDKNAKGFLKVRGIIRYLDDKGYHSGLIKEFAYKIWAVSSDNGSHTPYERPDYMPTKYTVQSITHALLDLLLWFKEIMNKNAK